MPIRAAQQARARAVRQAIRAEFPPASEGGVKARHQAELRWARTWALAGSPPPAGLLADLLKRYAEPHRRYHTIGHILDCLEQSTQSRHIQVRPAEVDLALWFHDAVCDPHRGDNEELSAALAAGSLAAAGLADESIRRIGQLILVTRHDLPAASGDSGIVVDVDLSILGASSEQFDAYESAIREEYAWVPEDRFRSRRAELLRGFLAREWIYSTAWFRERFETQARENLERSARQLADEQRWDAAFARSPETLDRLAARAREDVEAGRVHDVGWDEL